MPDNFIYFAVAASAQLAARSDRTTGITRHFKSILNRASPGVGLLSVVWLQDPQLNPFSFNEMSISRS